MIMLRVPSTSTLWLACWLLFALPTPTPAQVADWPAPNWQIDEAKVAAKSALTSQSSAQLNEVLQHQPDALVQAFETLAARSDLSWPIREAALMEFLNALASMQREQIPQDALAYLTRWQSKTRVPHEEMATLGAPLYDIAARAQGLQNLWRREAAMEAATAALKRGPVEFLTDWALQSEAATRAGFLDALDHSDRPTQSAVLAATDGTLHTHPDYAEVAARSALALRDLDAMRKLIVQGAGADTQALLRTCAAQLNADELHALLLRLRRDATDADVALAIGLWSSKLAGNAQAEALLLDLLGDPTLGSSAALALAQGSSSATRAELQSLAAAPDTSVRAARARLALQLDQVSEMPR
jgi:hypothetical protein